MDKKTPRGRLCVPVLDLMERLPDPQRDALGVAFGLRAGDAPDRSWWGWRC